jgi:hypothetical protein
MDNSPFGRAERPIVPGMNLFLTYVCLGGVSALQSNLFPVLAGPQSSRFAMRAAALTPTAAVRHLLRTCFSQWRILTLATLLQLARAAITTASSAVETSMWKMKKEDLIEMARRELRLENHQAAKATVIELREMIRQHRASAQNMRDPRLQVPKGPSKMTVAEPLQECNARDTQFEASSNSRGPNRAQMIMAIKQWVATAGGQEQPETDWYMDDPNADL